MNISLSSEAADTLESVGEAMVAIGVCWALTRAFPATRGPMMLAAGGVGLVVAARRLSETPTYRGQLFAERLEEAEVIDVTPSRSSVTA